MITLNITKEHEEDCYTCVEIDICKDGQCIGGCCLMVDEKSAYCEQLFIDEEYRNHGYGTEALEQLSSMYGVVTVAPDNEDARRLYERIGREHTGQDAGFDQGYGVYEI